jgi:carbonic anhydrase
VGRPEEAGVTATDELLARNEAYRASFDKSSLPLPPARKVAVLACMDARLDPAKALGLEEGDAHVIRNAGGVASEDATRSLVISQWLLGTEKIILIHHTDCGRETFTDDQVKEQIYAETGLRPSSALEAFEKAEDDVTQTARRIEASPFIPQKQVRGFVNEVESGALRELPLG